jgi:putative DNA primase/helicase
MKFVVDAAKGHWPEILAHFGVSLPARGKHGPCPACGGKDRFRFDDKEGRGSFYCSGCGAGDGFILLQKVKGISLQAATESVSILLGVTFSQKPTVKDDPKKAMRALWDRARKPSDDGPVQRYLYNRLGPHEPPLSIRECMSVYDPETKQNFPAMIAKIASPENKAENLHITYLTPDGRKAATPKPKRVMAGKLPEGSAIRLAAPAEVMGIAEGIETAMAASIWFEMPVWAAVSGVGLSKWTPPATAKTIYIFGDNDLSYAGQAKAYALAHRLTVMFKREVAVKIPTSRKEDRDWNDVLAEYNAELSMWELTNPFA